MTPLTLLHYLIGSRGAIETLAADRRAVWIGFLFVLSAALAREYDGADLLAEPWVLGLPVVASLITSFFLFLVLFAGNLQGRGTEPALLAFERGYRAFLGLFWMTAPLAWLYAIPYERFLAPRPAMVANLLTLGVVALWRVLLMVRVGSVLHGGPPGAVACRVLLVGSGIVALSLAGRGLPSIIPIMGGIRGTDDDQFLIDVGTWTFLVSACSFPLWLVGFSLTRKELAGQSALRSRGWPQAAEKPPSALGLWAMAAASLAVWIPVLPHTQPEQANRHRAESLFLAKRWPAFLDELSAHQLADYPPYWLPPPTRFLPRERTTYEIWIVLLDAMREHPPAPWVRRHYLERFNAEVRALERTAGHPTAMHQEIPPWVERDQLERIKEYFGEELYLPLFPAPKPLRPEPGVRPPPPR